MVPTSLLSSFLFWPRILLGKVARIDLLVPGLRMKNVGGVGKGRLEVLLFVVFLKLWLVLEKIRR